MILQLWEVEIRSAAPAQQLSGIMKEVEAEVEQARRYRLSVDQRVLLFQMPTPGPHDQRGQLLVQVVALSLRAGVFQRAADGVPAVELSFDHVGPWRRERVFEV